MAKGWRKDLTIRSPSFSHPCWMLNDRMIEKKNMGEIIETKDFKIKDDGTIVRGRKCHNCGRELLSEGSYCEYCGAKIGNSANFDDIENRVISIVKKGKRFKLEAVKLYHDEMGVDLKSAKRHVDDLYDKLSI